MLDFVTAAANLRSSVFGISSKSKFDVKRECDLGSYAPANIARNGWEYHPGDRNHQRHDRRLVRLGGV